MSNDAWTMAATVLSDFALVDTGPPLDTFSGITLAEWLASMGLGIFAAVARIPAWVCLCALAGMTIKELAVDIPHGGFALTIWADANLDLALPALGFAATKILMQRIKP